MDLGVALPTSGSWARPDYVREIARRAEEAGYRSLWTFQRLLYAGPPADPFGGRPGAEWPAVYESVLDPLTVLGFAAAVTSRTRVGVAVVNGPFYPPVVLAKALATIDVLSGGRLDAGVGLGWSRTEYAAAGVPYSGRGARLDEWLACFTGVLGGSGEVEFAGSYYSVPRSRFAPLPVQRPRPPLYIGGSGEPALRRAVEFGDGWVSSSAAGVTAIAGMVAQLRERGAAAGRSDLRAVSRGVVRLRDAPVEGGRPLEGTVEQIGADLGRYAQAGVDEVFLDLNFDSDVVGRPDADPEESMRRAVLVLDAFAPGA